MEVQSGGLKRYIKAVEYTYYNQTKEDSSKTDWIVKVGVVVVFLFNLLFLIGVKMTQQDLFEWSKYMKNKYGINEEQLVFPFVNNTKNKKEIKVQVLDEDDGYCD